MGVHRGKLQGRVVTQIIAFGVTSDRSGGTWCRRMSAYSPIDGRHTRPFSFLVRRTWRLGEEGGFGGSHVVLDWQTCQKVGCCRIPGGGAGANRTYHVVANGNEEVEEPVEINLFSISYRLMTGREATRKNGKTYIIPPFSISICIVPLLLNVDRLRMIRAR